jgi:hypothetical protein
MKLFEPLYSRDGGPPLGWYCFACESVFRTEVGVEKHLWLKHQLKLQTELPLDEAPQPKEL